MITLTLTARGTLQTDLVSFGNLGILCDQTLKSPELGADDMSLKDKEGGNLVTINVE